MTKIKQVKHFFDKLFYQWTIPNVQQYKAAQTYKQNVNNFIM